MSFTHAVTLNYDPELMLKPFKIFCSCSSLVFFFNFAKHKLLVRLRIVNTIDVYICIKN